MPFYVLFRKENIPYYQWEKYLQDELHRIYLMKKEALENDKESSPESPKNKSIFNIYKMFRFQRRKKKKNGTKH